MKWRYHVYGKDNEIIKVSEHVYDTEKAAIADAEAYVKANKPAKKPESWHAVASHQ